MFVFSPRKKTSMNYSQPYRPPLPQIPAGPLLGNPCDPRDPRRPMNPLAGIRATHRTTYGYREASPDGDSPPFRITATHPHYALLHLLRQRKGLRNGSKLLWFTVLLLRFECMAERGPAGFEISVAESVCLLC